ncbi:MAG: HAMP domain-containing sensor histidine kinase [Ilumatobacteraceae bacterium]
MLSVATLAVIGFGVPLAFIIERFIEADATATVERAAVLASREVSLDFATSDDPVEFATRDDGITLSLYDLRGDRFAGDGPLQADAVTLQALQNEVVDGEVEGQLVVAVPVAADESVVGAVRASRDTSVSDERTLRILTLLAGLGAGVVAVSGVLGWLLAGRLSRPVGRLRDAARQLGDGDFTIEVPASPVPELDQVAEAMNATADRLGTMVARERSFSSDASHQLRTPIAGMRAAIETELEYPRGDPAEALGELLEDVERLERTVTELLLIARTNPSAASIELGPVLHEIDSSWRRRIERHGRAFRVDPVRYSPPVSANSAMLRHLLDVLVDNALHHGRGAVAISVTSSEETVTIGVSDEGPGIPAAPSAPSTDAATAGAEAAPHGLGLPLATRLADAMGGRLRINPPGTSPTIELVLRRAEVR